MSVTAAMQRNIIYFCIYIYTYTYVRGVFNIRPQVVCVFTSKNGLGLNSPETALFLSSHYHMCLLFQQYNFIRNGISAICKSPHQGQIANVLYFRPAIISISTVHVFTKNQSMHQNVSCVLINFYIILTFANHSILFQAP